MCVPIFKSESPPTIYGSSGINLREFRPRPILDNRGKYFVKVSVMTREIERVDLMQALAESILNKLPDGFQVYTHFSHYYPGKFNGELKESGPMRLIKRQDGTFEVKESTWEKVNNGDPEQNELQNCGYVRVDLVRYYGFYTAVMLSKKKEKKLLHNGLIDKTKY